MSIQEKARALSLCTPESDLRYEVVHPEPNIIGICGVDILWKPQLDAANIPINSLRAGLFVYKHYKSTYNSNYKALKKYKGIQSTKYLGRIDKTEALKREYLAILE